MVKRIKAAIPAKSVRGIGEFWIEPNERSPFIISPTSPIPRIMQKSPVPLSTSAFTDILYESLLPVIVSAKIVIKILSQKKNISMR